MLHWITFTTSFGHFTTKIYRMGGVNLYLRRHQDLVFHPQF